MAADAASRKVRSGAADDVPRGRHPSRDPQRRGEPAAYRPIWWTMEVHSQAPAPEWRGAQAAPLPAV